MCGIAGIYSPSHRSPANKTYLKSMLGQIQYRGPDECGILTSRNLWMGNVRLNIIDLESGTQPICDQSERYWIVFNGEIFNYIELREELGKKGYRFKTRSDTEVLVQLYALYGAQCLSKLNGQFAFAIWDKKTDDLFLARDRTGIRPLFYSYQKGVFLFASEIKSILQYPGIDASINHKAIHQIFTFWAPLTPETSFFNIFEVPPAHCLTLRKGRIEVKRYWELSYSCNRSVSLDDALQEFEDLFYDAIKLRLRSDVPVAAYLSGGIDSTATTKYIQNIQPQNLQTFSIGFESDQYDETLYQNEASHYLQTTHKRFICRDQDIADHFSKIVWHTEVPVIRTAPAPMYFLSRLVRQNGIKVVITGEGADEMLAGYNIFKETTIRHFWSKAPESRFRPILLKKLYPYIPYIANANAAMLKMFFGYRLEDTASPFYSHLIRWNNTSRIKNYFSPELLNGYASYDPLDDLNPLLPVNFDQWSPLSKSQWLEINLFMSGYLLSSQGDRMAMANSVEGRYPFLDHRIMEFCSSIPEHYKLNGLTEKYLLKKLMAKKIPDSIVKRSKQAYRAPISPLINQATTSEAIRYYLSESQIRRNGLFDPVKVNGLKTKYTRGKNISEIDDMSLTGVISSQMLYDQFVHNRAKGQSTSSKLNIRKQVCL